MKKKNFAPLELDKETVNLLDQKQLKGIKGGTGLNAGFAAGSTGCDGGGSTCGAGNSSGCGGGGSTCDIE